MKCLVFMLEEPSMAEVLRAILPRILPAGIEHRLIIHEGKQDLERSIPRKLRAWAGTDVRFVIVRDQDAADCHDVKRRLLELCWGAGRPDSLVRVVCRELEAWFLGDLAAVEAAYRDRKIARYQNKAKFRSPDRLAGAKGELKQLVPEYQPLSGARAVAPHLEIDRNRSHSFQVFVRGVRRLASAAG